MWQVSFPAEKSGPAFPRRTALGCGSAAVASALGLRSDGNLLAGDTASVDVSNRGRACILFWMAGGPSHIDTWDMKPDAPLEVRGPFRPISTTLPGWDVCELMPGHARVAEHLAVIRSLRHTLAEHDDASHWVQTGYPQPQARQRGQQHPCEGAVASHLLGPSRPGAPAYVCVPEDYASHMGFYQGPAYLGSRHRAVNGGGDPALGNYRRPEFALPEGMVEARLAKRRELLGVSAGARADLSAARAGVDMQLAQERAFELMSSAASKRLFDATLESDATRDRYGHGALLARRLVEGGVRFVTINLYEKDVDWWDDHYVVEKNLRKRLPPFDQAFSALIEDLHDRGLADEVLVAAYGEFGRGPRIDQLAGRSHWPRAMSAILSGGGIRGGQAIGRTTSNGGEPSDRALGPADLLATIYGTLGIDPHATVMDRLGRPVPIVADGEPIVELIA
jgi:hypothetical protein